MPDKTEHLSREHEQSTDLSFPNKTTLLCAPAPSQIHVHIPRTNSNEVIPPILPVQCDPVNQFSTGMDLTPPYSPNASTSDVNGNLPVTSHASTNGHHDPSFLLQLFPPTSYVTPMKESMEITGKPINGHSTDDYSDIRPRNLSPVHGSCGQKFGNGGLLSVCTTNSNSVNPMHCSPISPVSRPSDDWDRRSSGSSSHGGLATDPVTPFTPAARSHKSGHGSQSKPFCCDHHCETSTGTAETARDYTLIQDDCVGHSTCAQRLLINDWAVGMTAYEYELRVQMQIIQTEYLNQHLKLKKLKKRCKRVRTNSGKSDRVVLARSHSKEATPPSGQMELRTAHGSQHDVNRDLVMAPSPKKLKLSNSENDSETRRISLGSLPLLDIGVDNRRTLSGNDDTSPEIFAGNRFSASPRRLATTLSGTELIQKQKLVSAVPLQTEALNASDAKVLLLDQGLFYVASVKLLCADALIYTMRVIGQRASRPYVMCQEELLNSAVSFTVNIPLEPDGALLNQPCVGWGSIGDGSSIGIFTYNEVCITDWKYLCPGDRVCALWSGQLQAFYPGTVDDTCGHDEKDRKGSPLITISFDDGDTGQIALADVRLLPADFPITKVQKSEVVGQSMRQRANTTASGRRTSNNNNQNAFENNKQTRRVTETSHSLRPSQNGSTTESTSSSTVLSKRRGVNTNHENHQKAPSIVAGPNQLIWEWCSSPSRVESRKGRRNRLFYEQVKYGNVIFSVGELVHLMNCDRQDLSPVQSPIRTPKSPELGSKPSVVRPYVAIIRTFWSTDRGTKHARAAWCYRADEINCDHGIRDKRLVPFALFRSTHEDDNEVETISERCEQFSVERLRLMITGDALNSADLSKMETGNWYFFAGDYDPVRNRLKMTVDC